MYDKSFFLQVLDDLMWEDCYPTISAKLVHTHPIKDAYIARGLRAQFPSGWLINKWMKEEGYYPLGNCYSKCSPRGLGTFWTRHYELFVTCGVVDRVAVRRCVHRRELYLRVKNVIEKAPVLSVGETAKLFKVSINTIREWDRKGLLPMMRTEGGHRRYDLSTLVSYP